MTGGIYYKVQIVCPIILITLRKVALHTIKLAIFLRLTPLTSEINSVNVDDVIELSNHCYCIGILINQLGNAQTEKYIEELHYMLKIDGSDSRKNWYAVEEYKKLPNKVGDNYIRKLEKIG